MRKILPILSTLLLSVVLLVGLIMPGLVPVSAAVDTYTPDDVELTINAGSSDWFILNVSGSNTSSNEEIYALTYTGSSPLNGWITAVPSSFSVSEKTPFNENITITITVPPGTSPGDYSTKIMFTSGGGGSGGCDIVVHVPGSTCTTTITTTSTIYTTETVTTTVPTTTIITSTTTVPVTTTTTMTETTTIPTTVTSTATTTSTAIVTETTTIPTTVTSTATTTSTSYTTETLTTTVPVTTTTTLTETTTIPTTTIITSTTTVPVTTTTTMTETTTIPTTVTTTSTAIVTQTTTIPTTVTSTATTTSTTYTTETVTTTSTVPTTVTVTTTLPVVTETVTATTTNTTFFIVTRTVTMTVTLPPVTQTITSLVTLPAVTQTVANTITTQLPMYFTVNFQGEITRVPMSSDGRILEPLSAPNPDGDQWFEMEEGTISLDEVGNIISYIEIRETNNPPPYGNRSPVDTYIVFPTIVTFDKAVGFTLAYEIVELPDDTESIGLANYMLNKGWTDLEAESNVVAGIGELTTYIEKSGIYSILAVVPETAPASFSLSALEIDRSIEKTWGVFTFIIKVGNDATVSAFISNSGGQEGTYTATLMKNGTAVATKDITLSAGKGQLVSFEITGNEPGDYTIEIGGLTGEFTSYIWINWWLIIGLAAAFVLIVWAGWYYGYYRRKQRAS